MTLLSAGDGLRWVTLNRPVGSAAPLNAHVHHHHTASGPDRRSFSLPPRSRDDPGQIKVGTTRRTALERPRGPRPASTPRQSRLPRSSGRPAEVTPSPVKSSTPATAEQYSPSSHGVPQVVTGRCRGRPGASHAPSRPSVTGSRPITERHVTRPSQRRRLAAGVPVARDAACRSDPTSAPFTGRPSTAAAEPLLSARCRSAEPAGDVISVTSSLRTRCLIGVTAPDLSPPAGGA